MPDRIRTFPLEIIRDHTVARIGTAAALIDTGSPLSFRAPSMISEQLGQPVRWLVGTDVLTRDRVLLDWAGRRLVVGGPALSGETIRLTPHAGLFQIEVGGAHGSALAFLDTGAHLSYVPASAVLGLVPVAHVRDFYLMMGSFDVPVYELTIRVGRRSIRGRFGVLPELLALLLAGLGGSGWILGSDFFRNRSIQLDLAHNQLIDATVPTPRQRTTRRVAQSDEPRDDAEAEDLFTVTNDERRASEPAFRRVTSGIEAWRGWRLEEVGGAPHIKSISAPDIWDGPCFSADELPTMARTRAGVHAYAAPGQMQSLLRGPALVYGQVTLYGQVCAHEIGYRAQHARVDRLFLRACGRHAPTTQVNPTRFRLLDLQMPGAYCACAALEPHQWLSYEELEDLARKLGDQYQCDVTIDAERARVATYACSHQRRTHNNQRTRI